jgi:hypothetical protein
MIRAKMSELGNKLRACSRELRQIGPPSDRLQPVYVLVQKACRTYDKGARCLAKAASVSDAAGATIAGTPRARRPSPSARNQHDEDRRDQHGHAQ